MVCSIQTVPSSCRLSRKYRRLTDSIRLKLGWGHAEEDDYALENNHIATVTDDEVRLKASF